jgi:hypothetical protein
VKTTNIQNRRHFEANAQENAADTSGGVKEKCRLSRTSRELLNRTIRPVGNKFNSSKVVAERMAFQVNDEL